MGGEGLPPRFTYGYPKQPTNVKEMKELVDGDQGGAFAPCYARSDLAKIETSHCDHSDDLGRIFSYYIESGVSGCAYTPKDRAKILREVLIHSQEMGFPHVVLADYVEYIRERIADLRAHRGKLANIRGNDAQRKIAFAIRGGKGVVVVKPWEDGGKITVSEETYMRNTLQ